jgi:hypothetical protein
MSDRMDRWLARLPDESPSPDLAPRIILAVAERRRVKARWRRTGIAAGALGLLGLALMAISWPGSGALPAALDGEALVQAVSGLLSAPLETLAGSAQAAIAWESALVEGIEIAFVLGAVLLTLGAVGGLARLLRRSESLNGYSQ